MLELAVVNVCIVNACLLLMVLIFVSSSLRRICNSVPTTNW